MIDFHSIIDEGGQFEAVAGFTTESDEAVLFLKKFSGWNPFPDDPIGINKRNSVSTVLSAIPNF